MKKPRADSRLKCLPEDVRLALLDVLERGRLVDGRQWCQEHGYGSPSLSSLSEFRDWQLAELRFQRLGQQAEQFMRMIQQEQPDISEEELFAHGQRFFSFAALQSEDVGVWKKVQQLQLQRDRMELDQRQFTAAQRSKLEAGLAALFEEIQGNEAALRKFEELQALVRNGA